MSSESLPTYSEIYENVLDRVESKLAEAKNLADREDFAQEIMDALAEAYRIGTLHAAQAIAANLNRTPHAPKPNPYER